MSFHRHRHPNQIKRVCKCVWIFPLFSSSTPNHPQCLFCFQFMLFWNWRRSPKFRLNMGGCGTGFCPVWDTFPHHCYSYNFTCHHKWFFSTIIASSISTATSSMYPTLDYVVPYDSLWLWVRSRRVSSGSLSLLLVPSFGAPKSQNETHQKIERFTGLWSLVAVDQG
jgi:hypothetical protein